MEEKFSKEIKIERQKRMKYFQLIYKIFAFILFRRRETKHKKN